MKSKKTNACRILDREHIPYELVEYAVDEEKLDAVSVAQLIGRPAGEVFKTLVLTGTAMPHFVVVIPGDRELNLKTTARLTGNKSCALLPRKDLLHLTGYVHGGCSPLGMKKALPTFVDRTALDYETISISAGLRGAQIILAADDLITASKARTLDLFASEA